MASTDVFGIMMEAAPLADKLQEFVKDEPLHKWFTAMIMAMLSIDVQGKPMPAETLAEAASVIAKIRDEAAVNKSSDTPIVPADGGVLEKVWKK